MHQLESKDVNSCLRAAKSSQGVIRSAEIEFSVDGNLAHTLTELSRSGEDLPVGSRTKARASVEQDLFKVSSNHTLLASECEGQRGQLTEARKEAEEGVPGSRLPTRYNLTTRVAPKMRKLALLCLLVPGFALTSCSAGPITTSAGSPSVPAQSVVGSTSPITPSSPSAGVPGSGQRITDALGSYEKTAPVKVTINSDALERSAKTETGFSDAQIASAEQFVGRFVSTQVIDSSAVDGGAAGWRTWIRANSDKYFTADQAPAIVANSNGKRSTVILTTLPKGTTFVRDGGVRVKREKVFVQDVEGYDDSAKRLQIGGVANVLYRISPAVAQAALRAAHPGASESVLKAKFPDAFNEAEDGLKFDLDYLYSVVPVDGTWKITGYSDNFHTEYSYN